MRESFNSLVELARTKTRGGRPAIEDPAIRQRLAEIEGYVRTSETSGMRQSTAARRGEMQKAMRPMMMNKIFSTDTVQRIMECAYDLLGGDGVLAPLEDELDTWTRKTTDTGWVLQYMFSLGPAIAGGASNIQLNIIGERGYGLPRDIRKSS
jgi:alkylation response protein AidB-like acyl-CoA dehydrogenase